MAEFKSHRALRRWGQLPTEKPLHPQLGPGTAVVEVRQNWRLQRGRIEPAVDDFTAADAEKVHYIPALELSWPVRWVHIACGEKVIDEILDHPDPTAST